MTIERFQHKFRTYIPFRLNKPMLRNDNDYEKLLNVLNVTCVADGRIVSGLPFLFKIINNVFSANRGETQSRGNTSTGVVNSRYDYNNRRRE